MDDIVTGRDRDGRLWYQGTRGRGGHSTYRIAFQDPNGFQAPDPTFERLTSLGCGYERVTPRLVAVDVPPEAAINAVYRVLEDGMASDEWWFDEMHCGHPIQAE